MRVPLLWLRDYVDIQVPVSELAQRLNDAGIEVESIDSIGAEWGRDKVFIGQVVAIEEHPNADRLTLPIVDYGEEQRQVVTGATNIKVGDHVPFAIEGATLVDAHGDGGPLVLTPAKIRGVESRGMVCSSQELGLSEDHDGILILRPDAPVGAPLVDYLGGDTLVLDLQPNRSDCLSMIGVARAVAGLFDLPLNLPNPGPANGDRSNLPELNIEIRDPSLSARYSAGYLHDLSISPSPYWMQRRLEAAGQRPINNLVDITNFVMLETGQPLHAFDWEKVSGNLIGVREAKSGETLRTLDGRDRSLSSEDTIIYDGKGPIALAGVMGGLESEVTENTTNILLEAATFNQTRIRNTSRRMGLRSEASRRFEQRLSPETTILALQRTAQLAEEIGAAKGIHLWGDMYPGRTDPVEIEFQLAEVPRLLGVDFPRDLIVDALQRSYLEVTDHNNDASLNVTVPYWRSDITIAADLVEEIAIMIGFDAIPSSLPSGPVVESVVNEIDHREELVKDLMVAAGYQEIIAYTTTSAERLQHLYGGDATNSADENGCLVENRFLPINLAPLRLVNPLRAVEDSLRTASLGQLLETLSANRRFTDYDLSLFELGKIFIPSNESLPEERLLLTAVTGHKLSIAGWDQQRESTFFDVKGLGELLLRRFNIKELETKPFRHPTFHPGRCAMLSSEDILLAAFGEISPSVCKLMDIDEPVWTLLVDIDKVLQLAIDAPLFNSLPRFPAVIQNISIVVPLESESAIFAKTISNAGSGIVESVTLVDEYRGSQLPADKRGLSYAIIYRHDTRTLTDAEVATQHAEIVRSLETDFGATLRT